MFKKSKNNSLIYILIVVLIMLVILFSDSIRNVFNLVYSKITFTNEKTIEITDKATRSYIDSLEDEITKLKSILDLNDTKRECINATVIYRNPTYWYNSLTINKGSKEKIKVGDMVVNNSGIIGIVSKVFGDSAIVSLITNIDEQKKITVALKDGDNLVYGIISGYDKIRNELIISEITSDLTNERDIDVVTTGFTNTFKEGIIIGKLNRLENSKDGLYKVAYVKPSSDYNDIKYVCVERGKW